MDSTRLTFAEGTSDLPSAIQAYIEDLCLVQSSSGQCERAIAYVCVALDRLGLAYVLDDYGNVITDTGDLLPDAWYPGLCAHLDTVHALVPQSEHEVYRTPSPSGSWTYTSPSGIGGDDKCGVALVLAMLKVHPSPLKAFFFLDEEVGCRGSQAMDSLYFDNVGYLVQPDRRGNADLIDNYHGDSSVNKKFAKVLRHIAPTYGYQSCQGLYTDVFYLQERVSLSAINFSCGYYNPHQRSEYINLADLLVAGDFLADLITEAGTRRYQRFTPVSDAHSYTDALDSIYGKSWYGDDFYYGYGYGKGEQDRHYDDYTDAHGVDWTYNEAYGMYIEAKPKPETTDMYEELFGLADPDPVNTKKGGMK